jgi:hypothetical protein
MNNIYNDNLNIKSSSHPNKYITGTLNMGQPLHRAKGGTREGERRGRGKKGKGKGKERCCSYFNF